jgi:hypothetical protein
MNIEDAIARFARMGENSVLVAKPPLTWGSEAMFVELTDDYRVPQPVQAAGYVYLLGRDDIGNLLEFLKRKKLGSRAIAEVVIHYAVTDSARRGSTIFRTRSTKGDQGSVGRATSLNPSVKRRRVNRQHASTRSMDAATRDQGCCAALAGSAGIPGFRRQLPGDRT